MRTRGLTSEEWERREVLRATAAWDSAWVPGLLAHLYGEKDAERLLRDAGW